MNSSFQIYLTLLFMTNPIVAQTKVIDLITPETKAWKSSSISQYFNVVIDKQKTLEGSRKWSIRG